MFREETGERCWSGDIDAAQRTTSGADGYLELDARAIPHEIRHAAVFGALGAVDVGQAMILVASHDPLPLLAQVDQRHPRTFEVRHLERGPQAWRVLLRRTAA